MNLSFPEYINSFTLTTGHTSYEYHLSCFALAVSTQRFIHKVKFKVFNLNNRLLFYIYIGI